MNNYFITGGAGFIGREVTKQLLSEGKKVTVYDDFSFGREANLEEFANNSNLKIVKGKIEDYPNLFSAMKESEADVVMNLAALHFIPYCNKYPLETLRVNVEGTYSVFEAATLLQIPKIVSTSSGAIYPSTEDLLIEDQQIAKPVDVYGCSKWLNENIGEFFSNKNVSKIITVRLFNTYGPFETNEHIIPEMMKQLQNGYVLKLGNVKTKRDYIYVEDTATGFIKLSQSTPESNHTIVNLGTGLEYSAEEIVSKIQDLLEHEIVIETDPSKLRPVDKMHQTA
ncbi:MAG: NAD(P)-dependent oxidoreductase, partial [Cytophagales bacterium]|nr:NAD(P)-dependent oxidoreductase [Cytophagales bacterium]